MEHIFHSKPPLPDSIRTAIHHTSREWMVDLDLEFVDDITDHIIAALRRNYTSAKIGHTDCIIVPTRPSLAPTEEDYGVAA
jgi:hypothetical protein